jgi:hypothetical protein
VGLLLVTLVLALAISSRKKALESAAQSEATTRPQVEGASPQSL